MRIQRQQGGQHPAEGLRYGRGRGRPGGEFDWRRRIQFTGIGEAKAGASQQTRRILTSAREDDAVLQKAMSADQSAIGEDAAIANDAVVGDVVKSYGSGATEVRAVTDVNLTFPAGQFCAVMGPSGCGKSTLLHLAGALEAPNAGRVLVNGADVSTMSAVGQAELRRRHVGYVFQQLNLIPALTAIENVMLPLELDGVPTRQARARAADMLRRDLDTAGIPYAVDGPNGPEHADFHALRHTYLTMLGRNGVDLRTVQELAGHSTPVLTARYSHRRLYDLAGGVDRLPTLVPPAEDSDLSVIPLRMTGTGGRKAQCRMQCRMQ